MQEVLRRRNDVTRNDLIVDKEIAGSDGNESRPRNEGVQQGHHGAQRVRIQTGGKGRRVPRR